MTPRTILAMGITNLGDPMPNQQPTLSKRKMKNARLKDEDYSQPHQPVKLAVVPKKAKAAAQFTDLSGLQITNDALPASRCAPVHKYHVVFERMRVGQCVRCATGEVGKVAGALRKFIEVKGIEKEAMVRTVMRYTDPKTRQEDVGFGRVWMMGVGKGDV